MFKITITLSLGIDQEHNVIAIQQKQQAEVFKKKKKKSEHQKKACLHLLG